MNADRPRTNWLMLPLFIGLTTLLIAGLFYGVAHNPFRRPYLRFVIRFDDVSGIHERSKVSFLGIPAGYVKDLNYYPEKSELAVDVEVVITRTLNIPADVTAHLEPTLLGEATIALRPCPQKSRSAPLLASGAEIRGQRSTRAEAAMPGFDKAFASVKENVSNVAEIVDKLEAILGNVHVSSESLKQLADCNSNDRPSVIRVLQRYEELATKFSRDAEGVELLIGKLGNASDAVIRASQQMRALGIKANIAMEEFHSRPFHYLTTTRPPQTRERPRNPASVPKN